MPKFNPAASIVGRIIAPHTAFTGGLELLKRHMALAHKQHKPHLIVITGETGCGKTFILDVLKKEVLGESAAPFRTDEGLVVKSAIGSVPAKPTPKGFLSRMLIEQYSVDDISRNTEEELHHRLVTLVNECETELLAIEEIQHLTDRGTEKNCHHVDDLFKTIHDGIPCLMVLSGVCPAAEAVIARNKQLVSRVRGYIRLPRFKWSLASHQEEFIRCLSTFREEIQKAGRSLPDIAHDDWAFRLYCTTGGIMRLLSNFLEEVVALAGEKKVLGLDDFSNAYGTFRFRPELEQVSFDPFGADFLHLPQKVVLPQVAMIGLEAPMAKTTKAGRRGKSGRGKK